MQLKEFSYDLPSELIAQHPLPDRDAARLMVVDRAAQKISHHKFSDLPRFLPPTSLIVLNDSKVIPARLIGHREKTGGQVEIFILKRLSDEYSYEAMIRPLGRLRIGEKIVFQGSSIVAELIDPFKKIVRFNCKDLLLHLETIGHMPLPPYIKRSDNIEDQKYYQTVYARKAGSVAAPTAGLHFTEKLLAQLQSQGQTIEKVTLHVNSGTFNPVKADDVVSHQMHREQYFVSAKAVKTIRQARLKRQKIIAVGTTSCRVLETIALASDAAGVAPANKTPQRATPAFHRFPPPQKIQGETDIFIYPGYSFKSTDVLITNFHLPQSTLLMLVYTFGSVPLMKRAYQEAISQQYRFYSYGDAMLIL